MEIDETDFLGSAATSDREDPLDHAGVRQDFGSPSGFGGVFRTDSTTQGGGKDRDGLVGLPLLFLGPLLKQSMLMPPAVHLKPAGSHASESYMHRGWTLMDELLTHVPMINTTGCDSTSQRYSSRTVTIPS
jgi:hypothetical protein